jgi:hypothetical protein
MCLDCLVSLGCTALHRFAPGTHGTLPASEIALVPFFRDYCLKSRLRLSLQREGGGGILIVQRERKIVSDF